MITLDSCFFKINNQTEKIRKENWEVENFIEKPEMTRFYDFLILCFFF